MKTLPILCLVIASVSAADKIPGGKKLFIEKMENDLDGYLKAEIIKQHVPVVVVLSKDEADLVLTGNASEEQRRKWHQGWLTAEQDRTTGNLSLIDTKQNAMVWAGEAGDRSLMWGTWARGGHRKVAARLVDKMKGAFAKK